MSHFKQKFFFGTQTFLSRNASVFDCKINLSRSIFSFSQNLSLFGFVYFLQQSIYCIRGQNISFLKIPMMIKNFVTEHLVVSCIVFETRSLIPKFTARGSCVVTHHATHSRFIVPSYHIHGCIKHGSPVTLGNMDSDYLSPYCLT